MRPSVNERSVSQLNVIYASEFKRHSLANQWSFITIANSIGRSYRAHASWKILSAKIRAGKKLRRERRGEKWRSTTARGGAG
jgi:hypothetical protein